MKYFWVLLSLFIALSYSCDDDDKNVTVDQVVYRVKVIGNWNGTNHPVDYPSNSHFSPVIGMTHKQGVRFFQLNNLASDGMENMSETGGTSPLDSEIQAVINTGGANKLIRESGLSSGSGSYSFDLIVNKDFPSVTLVSMIAPSPDWFVAAENVLLFEDNCFVNHKLVNTVTYDAGTDDGVTFKSPDADTQPPGLITYITDAPLGNGTTVEIPLMLFEFTRMD